MIQIDFEQTSVAWPGDESGFPWIVYDIGNELGLDYIRNYSFGNYGFEKHRTPTQKVKRTFLALSKT